MSCKIFIEESLELPCKVDSWQSCSSRVTTEVVESDGCTAVGPVCENSWKTEAVNVKEHLTVSGRILPFLGENGNHGLIFKFEMPSNAELRDPEVGSEAQGVKHNDRAVDYSSAYK